MIVAYYYVILGNGVLQEVLKMFGFSHLFCRWIKEILRLAHLSVLFNGNAVGYFLVREQCDRGALFPLSFFVLRRRCLVELFRWKEYLIVYSQCLIVGVCLCRHIFFILMMSSFVVWVQKRIYVVFYGYFKPNLMLLVNLLI